MGNDRQLSQSDLAEIARAAQQESASVKRDALIHQIELKLVELIGVDSDGGEFQMLKERVDKMTMKMEKIESFTDRAKWTIVIFSSISGFVLSGALWLLNHYLK